MADSFWYTGAWRVARGKTNTVVGEGEEGLIPVPMRTLRPSGGRKGGGESTPPQFEISRQRGN